MEFEITLTVKESNGFFLKQKVASIEVEGHDIEFGNQIPTCSPFLLIDGKYYLISSQNIVDAVCKCVLEGGN